MAIVDAVDWAPIAGGVGAAQIGSHRWTTPFAPFGLNLEGFTTNPLISPLQPNYLYNESVSPHVEVPLRGALTEGFNAKRRAVGRRVDGALVPFPGYGEIFWFDRLHILPLARQLTDLGNLVNDVDTSFELLNTHRVLSATISTLQQDGTDGFTILEGELAPFTLPAYNSTPYTIRAEIETGPPTIAATYTWIPASSAFFSVYVSFIGNRITTFGFVPQRSHQRALTWNTAVVESYNGIEQRMAMKALPEMDLTYSFVLGGPDDPYHVRPQQFEHMIFDSLGRTWLVPDWPDRTVLTSNVSIGDTVINVNTIDRNFEVGELILLWREWNDSEAQAIVSVSSSSITVASPFVNAFAVAGTEVLPSWLGFMQDGPRQTVFKVDFVKWTLTFKRRKQIAYELYGSPEGVVPGSESYKGIPFWPRAWRIDSNSIDRTWRRGIRFIDGLGQLDQSYRLTTPKRSNSTMIVETDTRAELVLMRSWLTYLRGQQRSFWLPTYYNNFALSTPALAGSTVLRVVYNGYEQFVHQREQFKYIRVELSDGSPYYHEIIDSNDAGSGNLDLTITPGVATGVSPDPGYNLSNVTRIEYITKHRLATDNVVFQSLDIKDQYRVQLSLVEVLGEV